ncbi:MAG: 50S ribosomal protein L29 [Candidatus Pacearchaeota archaeon]|nr:50S ribosomal protein L29 [Candidatus Pacearchaeota archaeon]
MTLIRKKEIQKLNEQELKEKKKELELELLKIRAQKGQSAGIRKIKEIRRTMARINTQLNQFKRKT